MINWLIAKLMSQCGMSTMHGSYTSTDILSMVLFCFRVNANARPKFMLLRMIKLLLKVMSPCGTSTMVHLIGHFEHCSHLC